AVAVAAGWLYSVIVTIRGGGDVFYEAATVLCAFVLLGHWLEMRARGGGDRALPAAPDRGPPAASGFRGGGTGGGTGRGSPGGRGRAHQAGRQGTGGRRGRGRHERGGRVGCHRREPSCFQGPWFRADRRIHKQERNTSRQSDPRGIGHRAGPDREVGPG